jgi:hypothetical protein
MKSKQTCGVWILAAIALAPLCAQEVLPLQKTQDSQIFGTADKSGRRLWTASVVTLSVANVLDVQSSMGKRELNSALASPAGTLGTRGIVLKSGLQGGLLGIEYLLLRGHSHNLLQNQSRSKLYRTLAVINFASSAVIGGFVAHNYTVPQTHP